MTLRAKAAPQVESTIRDNRPVSPRMSVRGVSRLAPDYSTTIAELVGALDVDNLLEIGCGDGSNLDDLSRFKPSAQCRGVDLSERMIEEARLYYPGLDLAVGAPHQLDCADNSYDLVVACDLFQRLHDPQRVLREMVRVSRRYALFVVPREPLWRWRNLVQLSHVIEGGSPRDHVQRYLKRDFLNMVRGHFDLVSVRGPLPWVVVLGRIGVA